MTKLSQKLLNLPAETWEKRWDERLINPNGRHTRPDPVTSVGESVEDLTARYIANVNGEEIRLEAQVRITFFVTNGFYVENVEDKKILGYAIKTPSKSYKGPEAEQLFARVHDKVRALKSK